MSPDELAAALAATCLEDPEDASDDEVARMLTTRGPLLHALAELSRAPLPEPSRQRLAACVELLQAHDACVLDALHTRRAEVARAERALTGARDLARAYRAAPAEPSGVTLRRA